MTKINLCNIPYLSTDYSTVFDFESKASRDNYFKERTLETIEGNSSDAVRHKKYLANSKYIFKYVEVK